MERLQLDAPRFHAPSAMSISGVSITEVGPGRKVVEVTVYVNHTCIKAPARVVGENSRRRRRQVVAAGGASARGLRAVLQGAGKSVNVNVTGVSTGIAEARRKFLTRLLQGGVMGCGPCDSEP